MVANLKAVPTASEPTITLRQRVADALTKDTTTAELRSCLADTQADIARVERDRISAEAKAVDPLSTEEEATEAKRQCESLRFDMERLKASEIRLNIRLDQIAEREAQAALRARYDEVRAERDAVIAEMTEHYPQLAEGIVALLERMRVTEGRIAEVNTALPRGADRLPWIETGLAEPITLNLYGSPSNASVPPLYQSVQLPRLVRTGGNDDFYKLFMRNTQGVLPY
ncbi:hypothetical protein ACFQE0_21520 [Methylobacterium komagatae]|uniref:Uncharacterized protein n=1 Tax=Methylobacterium komagatae TaxID=374425 RepID=A0ABW2BQ17_9HYPH